MTNPVFSTRDLYRLHVLVVEDEPLLAFDYQDELEARGARAVVALTLAEGLEACAASQTDFAIIDINLGAEVSWPLARALTQQGVRYMIVSGRCSAEGVPAGLDPLCCIDKPIGARKVVDRIEDALRCG